MKGKDKLFVVIPAFNAADTIEEVLKGVVDLGYPVVVVNDGSVDATAKKVHALPQVELLEHGENRGKGEALKTGFSYALTEGATCILTMDADGQHAVADVPSLLTKFDELEGSGAANWGIIIGSRFHSKEDIPSYRYYPNRVGKSIIGWVVGQEMRDTQSGFRLYNTAMLRKITLSSTRFETETEVIIKAAHVGFTIHFAPISVFYPEDESEKTNFRPIIDTYRISILVLPYILAKFFRQLYRRFSRFVINE